MTEEKVEDLEPDAELEAMLKAERARQKQRVWPLLGAGVGLTMVGATIYLTSGGLALLPGDSEFRFVLPGIARSLAVMAIAAGLAMAALATHILRILKNGKGLSEQ